MAGLEKVVAAVKGRLLKCGIGRDHVEDLLQEAVVRLLHYEKRHPVEHREGFLYRTARNLAVDRIRHQKMARTDAMEDHLLAQIADLQPSPAAVSEARARLQHLEDGLSKLSPGVRRVLLLRRLEGISVREIAGREGLSVAAVEKRIARATCQLLQWMETW